MSAESTTVHPEELHLHINKPATPMDSTPQACCQNCTAHGKRGVDTRWICGQCTNRPGLCSRQCFEEWHIEKGFEILSAARRVRTESAPAHPEPQEARVHQPQVIHELARELLSAADWVRRQEREHILCIKPPTKKKKDPKLACIECRAQSRGRVERRTIFQQCKPQRVF